MRLGNYQDVLFYGFRRRHHPTFSYGFRRLFVVYGFRRGRKRFLMVSVVGVYYGFRRGRKRFLMASVAERFLMVSVSASNVFCCFVLSRQVTTCFYRGK